MVTGQPPAGWYPDPNGRPFERFWDGRTWTTSTRPVPVRSPAPVPVRPVPPRLPSNHLVEDGQGPTTSARRPALPASAPAAGRTVTPVDGTQVLINSDEPATLRPLRPGLVSITIAVAALVPAAIGALAITVPIAYGLHLVWPLWGLVAPFAIWVVGAVVTAWPQSTIQRAWYGYRDPTADEHRRLIEPSRRALRRLGFTAGRYRLMIVKSGGPNAPAVAGRTVVVTSHAVNALPPDRMEAVLAHELCHHHGLHAVPVFCHTHLTLPIRALWWLLARIWQPVRRMWAVAKRWHTPFGFLVSFLLALTAMLIFLVSVIPAGIAIVGAGLARFSTDRMEYLADATVADLGLGPQLLATLEAAIEAGHTDTDRTTRLLAVQPLIVRRAQRLRHKLMQ
jgi:Zn-dependent protease with chaperone function